MNKTYYVEFVCPSGARGIIESTKGGIEWLLADKIAMESEAQFKPLKYFVREFYV